MTAENGEVSDIRIAIDAGETLLLPVSLEQGWSVRYEGGTSVTVRDAEHRHVRDIPVGDEGFRLTPGPHTVMFDSSLMPEQEAKAKLELRPRGHAEKVAG